MIPKMNVNGKTEKINSSQSPVNLMTNLVFHKRCGISVNGYKGGRGIQRTKTSPQGLPHALTFHLPSPGYDKACFPRDSIFFSFSPRVGQLLYLLSQGGAVAMFDFTVISKREKRTVAQVRDPWFKKYGIYSICKCNRVKRIDRGTLELKSQI